MANFSKRDYFKIYFVHLKNNFIQNQLLEAADNLNSICQANSRNNSHHGCEQTEHAEDKHSQITPQAQLPVTHHLLSRSHQMSKNSLLLELDKMVRHLI